MTNKLKAQSVKRKVKTQNLKFLVFSFSFALLAFNFALNCFAGEQQKLPFIGKIKSDNVNIRAGANQNYEILAKANSADLLYVAEEAYGWYKVRLPKSAHCYAAKDFIEKNGNEGVSKAGNLNLRARPNRESSIVGQARKGDKITIVSEDIDGWYEIFPPESSFGWVRADLIEYTTNSTQPVKEEVKVRPAPAAIGQVQNMGFTFRRRPGSHRLVLGGKTTYYLKSGKYNLKNFEGEAVAVWGDISDLKADKLVIDVTEIEICR